MRRDVRFFVEGRPTPKERPRFSFRSGHAYTTKKTREYETLVATRAAEAAVGNQLPLEGPVNLSARFVYKKRGVTGEAPCETGADLDNLIKAVMDGATAAGILKNDKQVQSICASKHNSSSEEGVYVMFSTRVAI